MLLLVQGSTNQPRMTKGIAFLCIRNASISRSLPLIFLSLLISALARWQKSRAQVSSGDVDHHELCVSIFSCVIRPSGTDINLTVTLTLLLHHLLCPTNLCQALSTSLALGASHRSFDHLHYHKRSLRQDRFGRNCGPLGSWKQFSKAVTNHAVC